MKIEGITGVSSLLMMEGASMVQSRRTVKLPHVNGAVAATSARVSMISHVERRSVRRSTPSTTARHQRRALETAVAAGRMGSALEPEDLRRVEETFKETQVLRPRLD